MANINLVEFGTSAVDLNPLPVCPEWILQGAPVAHAKVISASTDGTSRTVIWHCTAGRFNWFYDIDETVLVLEGSAVIAEHNSPPRKVAAGDTILFRAGAKAEWLIDGYIRKIAFFRNPVPRHALLAIKLVRGWNRLMRVKRPGLGEGSMSNA